MDAEELLSRLVFRGWPDDYLFKQSVTELLSRARRGGRRVRAFGEMVALLQQGKDVIAVVLGSNRGHVWQESASLLAYGLGIRDTQLTSLRAVASPIPDDEE
jgi:hypothetical protein